MRTSQGISLLKITVAVTLLVFTALGCKPKSTMPAPLPVDQLPAALEHAFSKAASEAKDLAGQVVAAVRAQQYPKAHSLLQTLAAMPKLTAEQLQVAARGSITLTELLQTAQAQGDQTAAQTLQEYRANK